MLFRKGLDVLMVAFGWNEGPYWTRFIRRPLSRLSADELGRVAFRFRGTIAESQAHLVNAARDAGKSPGIDAGGISVAAMKAGIAQNLFGFRWT
jgi:hypothetical protein